jgi:hypothetical protein
LFELPAQLVGSVSSGLGLSVDREEMVEAYSNDMFKNDLGRLS